MGSVSSLVNDALNCPACCTISLLVIWVWVKIFTGEYQERYFTISRDSLLLKKEYWRILTAPVTHSTFLELFFNVTVLWNCRLVELNFGSLFFLKYWVLLSISELLLAFLLIDFMTRLTGPSQLSNISLMGCAGINLAWLGFQSLNILNFPIKKSFVLLGFFSFPPVFAPLVMIIVYSLVCPKQTIFSQFGGLVSGYLLAFGLLQFLSSTYWSLCFLFNIVLLVAVSIVNRAEVLNNPEARLERGADSDDVLSVIPLANVSDSSSSSRFSSAFQQSASTDLEEGFVPFLDRDDNDNDANDDDDADTATHETRPLLVTQTSLHRVPTSRDGSSSGANTSALIRDHHDDDDDDGVGNNSHQSSTAASNISFSNATTLNSRYRVHSGQGLSDHNSSTVRYRSESDLLEMEESFV
jgi:membrane associated rhomboid family serine protease